MAKNSPPFAMGYFLVIFALSWILFFLPEEPVSIHYHRAARMLLYCIIAYCTWPYVKRIFIREKVSSENKAVLITGCDSGFGHNLAILLDSKGFLVFASCLYPSGDGAKALQKICSNSLQILGLDVSKDKSVKEALAYVKQHLNGSKLWAVVNIAGIVKGYEIEWTRAEDFQDVMDIKSMGVVRVTKAFLPLLRRSRGRVVTITSLLAGNSMQSVSAYYTSKFATSCFCECLRQEMHPWGVKVITIEPDLFSAPITNWEVIRSTLDALMENFDLVYKQEYEEYDIDGYKKLARGVLLLGSSQIYEVLNCFEDAVMLKEPCYVYRPRGNMFYRLAFGILDSLPKPFVDIVSRFVSYILEASKRKEAE